MSNVEEAFEENKCKGDELQLLCIRCHREARHRVVQSLDSSGKRSTHRGALPVEWKDSYQIVQCLQCEAVSFRHVHWGSDGREQTEAGPGEDAMTETLFPER